MCREVQRILMELLNQMDGFDQTVNVKVIMATNRADTLDPALLRPGRLDRKIEFPLPDRRQKRLVFQVRLRCYCSGHPVMPVLLSRVRAGFTSVPFAPLLHMMLFFLVTSKNNIRDWYPA